MGIGAAAKGATSLGTMGGGGFAGAASGGVSGAGMAGWGSGIGNMAATAGTTKLGTSVVPGLMMGGTTFAGSPLAAAYGGKGSSLMQGARTFNTARQFMPQGQQEVEQQGFLGNLGRGAAGIWNNMGGAAQGALISGGFGALGSWADSKEQAKIRADDRKHEREMAEYDTGVERENFDDRNRLMGMGRDGQGGVSIDPNMVKNWGLGDMSLPRRSIESYPPPNTPLSDKLRAGFLSGGL
jgi:hypothetical protein